MINYSNNQTTLTKLTSWPSPQDYNEAIQSPLVNLNDSELSDGLVYVNHMGLPKPLSGAFASVYRLKCKNRDVALRCFLNRLGDRELRYRCISSFLLTHQTQYTVSFDFLEQGIKINNDWVPALKMDWIQGLNLDSYIKRTLNNPGELKQLARSFLKMTEDLNSAGIAHGDLQHGNIIVLPDGQLRLVDYDAMFVPSMEGMQSVELGHANYQHPARRETNFGDYLDRFSTWVIYVSIVGAQYDPDLWLSLGGGDDCLLFRECDFKQPLLSPAFAAFERHTNPELRTLGKLLRGFLQLPLEQVPPLQSSIPDVPILEDLHETVSTVRICTPAKERTQIEQGDALAKGSAEDCNGEQWFVAQPEPVVVHSLPAEFRLPAGRRVEYNRKLPELAPIISQLCMLLNPVLWLTVFYLWSGVGVDAELTRNGRVYRGQITNVIGEFSNNNKSYKRTVDYEYRVNDVLYHQSAELPGDKPFARSGQQIEIRALPSNPNITEPIFGMPGTRQIKDLGFASCFMLLTILCELWIWLPALTHKRMAQNGTISFAIVTNKRMQRYSPKSSDLVYLINVEFQLPDLRYCKTSIKVPLSTYESLEEGNVTTVIYNPDHPADAMLYELCRYQICDLQR